MTRFDQPLQHKRSEKRQKAARGNVHEVARVPVHNLADLLSELAEFAWERRRPANSLLWENQHFSTKEREYVVGTRR